MGDAAAFTQLLRIRNMRADNLARELAEIQQHMEGLVQARATIERQLREEQARANAALFNVLQPGHRVDGRQLQRAADAEAASRANIEGMRRRYDEIEREKAAVEVEIARCTRELQRARRTALRTELVLDEIEREPPR